MPLDGQVNPLAQAVEKVCAAFYEPESKARSRKRDTGCVKLRWACWLVLNDRLECTPSEIAREFEMDHTTVLYGLKLARKKLTEDAEWRAKVIAAGEGLTRAFSPPPSAPVATELDYVVLDRIVGQYRNACLGKLRSDPEAFRAQNAVAYRRIREALASSGSEANKSKKTGEYDKQPTMQLVG